MRLEESVTQPKIPPWAAIISSPTRWNSGKYEPTQSAGHQDLVAPVVRLAHGGVHADLGGDAGDDQAGDVVGLQDRLQVGGIERPFARLVDHDLSVGGRQLVDDVVSVLTADQDAAVRSWIADSQRRLAPAVFRIRQIRQVGSMTLTGVDDQQAGCACRGEQVPQRRDHGGQLGDIVAKGFAEAAGQQEVALHVDDEQCDLPGRQCEWAWFGRYDGNGHGREVSRHRSTPGRGSRDVSWRGRLVGYCWSRRI